MDAAALFFCPLVGDALLAFLRLVDLAETRFVADERERDAELFVAPERRDRDADGRAPLTMIVCPA